jgi:heparanase 1
VWTPVQAQRLLDLTKEAGGSIYGAELFNEPSVPPFGGFPKGYKASDFARDYRVFYAWARKAAPSMKLMGPGSASEGTMLKHTPENEARGFLESDHLLHDNPGMLDVFAYHYYGGVSMRCGGSAAGTKETALTAEWLDQTLIDHAFYAELRDKYAPGKPIWLNETAQAACGGSPWASTFLDSFRYLNQLGALAQKGVQVVAHNTLAASDYALIDYDTMMPRPNYWATVLWRRTMGSTVLASPASPTPDLRLYAHCSPGRKGSVGLLAINTGTAPQRLAVGGKARAWFISEPPLAPGGMQVNLRRPTIEANGQIKGLEPLAVSGSIAIPGRAIAFFEVAGAANKECR